MLKMIDKMLSEYILKDNFKLTQEMILLKKRIKSIHSNPERLKYFSSLINNSKGYTVLEILPWLYANGNIKNNKVKTTDFLLLDEIWKKNYYSKSKEVQCFNGNEIKYVNHTNSNISSAKKMRSSFSYKTSDYNLVLNEVDFNPDNLSDDFKVFFHIEKEVDSKINSIQLFNKIKKDLNSLNIALDKTIIFYDDLFACLKHKKVKEFVEKYKENKEIIVALFMSCDNYMKEIIFHEMKSNHTEISFDDMRKVINLLDDINYIYFVILMKNDMDLDREGFAFIKTLMHSEHLKDELGKKNITNSPKLKKSKI